MKYNRYIKDSALVSEIGLGAWQLGNNSGWRACQKGCCRTSSKALNTALIFDTAPNYGQGTSELRLGKALKSTDRSQLVINTKFGHTDGV
jgi:aryl-alcohol dehydrogenase-like predicted oxidoreductase